MASIWAELKRRNVRRVSEASKGDRLAASMNHINYAADLTNAGLYEAAIEELEVMFEQPGGHGFRLVDSFPVF